MKGQRHNEEQIINVLKEAQAGATVKEVCRRHNISDQTCYKWKRKYGGMEVPPDLFANRHQTHHHQPQALNSTLA